MTSYQSVRQRNENKEQDHAALRKHMMEAQSDPEKIIEGLATNMGFWLLEQVIQRVNVTNLIELLVILVVLRINPPPSDKVLACTIQFSAHDTLLSVYLYFH